MITHMILDLDGTLVDTEIAAREAFKAAVESFGKVYDPRSTFEQLGKQAQDAAASLVEEYSLPCTAEFFHGLFTAKIATSWSTCVPMPGACRLLQHLAKHHIPTALATNTERVNVTKKLELQGWQSFFRTTVAGDEVTKAKPDPEIYRKAASAMGARPENCLVIEDSLPGIAAAKAAGMEVIGIPSTPVVEGYENADHVLPSLLEFRPELWGLPAFQDELDP